MRRPRLTMRKLAEYTIGLLGWGFALHCSVCVVTMRPAHYLWAWVCLALALVLAILFPNQQEKPTNEKKT